MVRTNNSITIATAIVVLLSVLQGVSADRTTAVEETILIDTDDADVHFLLTESGTPVKIWIDDIDGADGGSGHPRVVQSAAPLSRVATRRHDWDIVLGVGCDWRRA